MQLDVFANPFRAGAGHMPPYLAGRTKEQDVFKRLLTQDVITDNLILTGLRGVGKTVLLAQLRPLAIQQGWLWTGEDLTEQASLNEERIAQRIITDLSVMLSQLFVKSQVETPIGYVGQQNVTQRPLGYADFEAIYNNAPGIVSDKLKFLLREVGRLISGTAVKGIVFAYDEAQLLSDHAAKDQYPLSLILDVFQSIQKSPGGLPFMLVLTGLPTLQQKLVNARTYSGRMFEPLFLDGLSDDEARQAITVPIQNSKCPVSFPDSTVNAVLQMSGGYPYYIQFICREIYDLYLSQLVAGAVPVIPESEILRKLDNNFLLSQWDQSSDAQKTFLNVVSQLPDCEVEFSAQDIVVASKNLLEKSYSNSSATQYITRLCDAGMIYKNRRGKYQLAIPLLSRFIRRQAEREAKALARRRASGY